MFIRRAQQSTNSESSHVPFRVDEFLAKSHIPFHVFSLVLYQQFHIETRGGGNPTDYQYYDTSTVVHKLNDRRRPGKKRPDVKKPTRPSVSSATQTLHFYLWHNYKKNAKQPPAPPIFRGRGSIIQNRLSSYIPPDP